MEKLYQIRIILFMAALLLFAASCKQLSLEDKAAKIHKSVQVIDTHTDTPMNMVKAGFDVSSNLDASDTKVDFHRLRQGGVDGVFFALFTSQRQRTPENYERAYLLARQMRDSTFAACERAPHMAGIALHADDVENFEKHGITAIFLGMENGYPLAKDLSRVEEFYHLGVRYITLAHTSNNDICDSSTDKKGPEHDGLSDFGKQVVAEMNRLGMIVDVSHISDKAFFDVLETSKAPIIASHSSIRALCDHPRNMSDEMIKALAANGGVIQICILGSYIAPDDTTSANYIKIQELRHKYNNWNYSSDEERQQAWAEWDSINKYYPPVLPDIAKAVDHIDHVVKLVGIDYVGIGSDFDGGGGLSDCSDVADFPKITLELVKRGYSESDIRKIWGGNFLRVFNAVEKHAQKHSI